MLSKGPAERTCHEANGGRGSEGAVPIIREDLRSGVGRNHSEPRGDSSRRTTTLEGVLHAGRQSAFGRSPRTDQSPGYLHHFGQLEPSPLRGERHEQILDHHNFSCLPPASATSPP